jgi:hypothetical protein
MMGSLVETQDQECCLTSDLRKHAFTDILSRTTLQVGLKPHLPAELQKIAIPYGGRAGEGAAGSGEAF